MNWKVFSKLNFTWINGKRYLLQKYDKDESLFFDVDDINEFENEARSKVVATSDKKYHIF